MLKVGDKLPAGTLQEFIEIEGNGCTIGPNTFEIEKSTAGKTIAIFGLPGGPVIPLFDALHDDPDIRTFLVRHEQGAGHMAEGYAKVTGRAGVCTATSGPAWDRRSAPPWRTPAARCVASSATARWPSRCRRSKPPCAMAWLPCSSSAATASGAW